MNLRRKHQEGFKIDISALVDVLFTLLIFFSLTSTFVKDSGLSVELPSATSSDTISSTKRIDIHVSEDGEIHVDKKITPLENLEKFLSKIDIEERINYLVVVKADKNAQHG
ncbi:MAG: biopolymer transporter ExbD, partial [bacterium]